MAERRLTLVASRGLLWTYGSTAAIAVTQVAYTAVTARSVLPSTFGAYAASQALALLFSYLSLATVGNAVIRLTDLERPLVTTAWTLAAAGGLAAATAALLLSPLWAGLWNVRDHVALVALAAPTVLLLPLSNLAVALLRRKLDYGRAALTELVAAVVGMATIGAALASTREAWLLPLAMPLSLLISTAGACFLAGELPRFGWSRAAARQLSSFLAPVSGMYASHYLVTTWPQLLVGRLFGSAALGHLSRGNMLVMTPAAHLAGGLSKVLFPLLTRVRGNTADHRRFVTKLLVLATGVAAVTFGALAGAADPIVRVLLGDGWDAVAGLIPVLAVGAAANLLLVLSSTVLENALRTRDILLTQVTLLAVATVISVCLLVAGIVSPTTVLWIFSGAQLCGHSVQLARLTLLGMVEVRPLVSAYLVHGALGLAVFGMLSLSARLTAAQPAWVSAAVALGLLTVLTGLSWAGRRSLPVMVALSSLEVWPARRRPAAPVSG